MYELSFTINGNPRTYDPTRLMFSEAMELQRATGLNAADFEKGLLSGDTLAYGAMFWISDVRALAAERSLPFHDAALELPFASWDTNLNQAIGSVRKVEQPDPTDAPTDPSGPAATTSQDTSEPVSPEPTTPDAAAPISESSPSSSASVPGSGTDSPSPTSTA